MLYRPEREVSGLGKISCPGSCLVLRLQIFYTWRTLGMTSHLLLPAAIGIHPERVATQKTAIQYRWWSSDEVTKDNFKVARSKECAYCAEKNKNWQSPWWIIATNDFSCDFRLFAVTGNKTACSDDAAVGSLLSPQLNTIVVIVLRSQNVFNLPFCVFCFKSENCLSMKTLLFALSSVKAPVHVAVKNRFGIIRKNIEKENRIEKE